MLSRVPRAFKVARRAALDRVTIALLRASRRRVLELTRTDRIGHLMAEIDCVMKEEHLRKAPVRRPLLLAPRGRVANRHALRYWRRYVDIVESPWLCKRLKRAGRDPSIRFRDDMRPYFTAINETARGYRILAEWGDRGPLLQLEARDVERGEARLRKLGIPEGAPFVCFHCRDGGYSPGDEYMHTYRNVSVESYLPAMKALRDRGIIGVRMGDPTMPPLSAVDGVVDYAHSPLRSEWMDVFLCASCEFFLGNSSGLYLVSLAFGKPSALANLAPMSTSLGAAPGDLAIPKLLWHEKEERLLTFREILGSPIGNYRYAEEYRAAGIRALENDPEDVTALALEMLARLRGEAVYDEADRVRQERFRSLFEPSHYAHGSAGHAGRDFLRRHEPLLV